MTDRLTDEQLHVNSGGSRERRLNAEIDALHARVAEQHKQQRALSDAYVRVRAIIPGAFDTPPAPSVEQVWAITEAAAERLCARVAQLEAALRDYLNPDIPEFDCEKRAEAALASPAESRHARR